MTVRYFTLTSAKPSLPAGDPYRSGGNLSAAETAALNTDAVLGNIDSLVLRQRAVERYRARIAAAEAAIARLNADEVDDSGRVVRPGLTRLQRRLGRYLAAQWSGRGQAFRQALRDRVGVLGLLYNDRGEIVGIQLDDELRGE